ncbi:unnamed protein product [Closterium sp. Naga37s-1]|nr:unnamed protein product [Closterium sp. Naga37s-1]
MVPGDVAVDLKQVTSSVLRIGPGLRQEGDMVVGMRAGRLKPAGKRKLWVDCSVKRYTPAVEEAVIGIVIDKHMENLDVDIKGPGLAILPALAFEGATRRNRPNLQIGQAVYTRVVKTHRDADPELSCVDASGKAAEFGPLVGGHLFDCSTALARLLLATPTAPVLKALDAAVLRMEQDVERFIRNPSLKVRFEVPQVPSCPRFNLPPHSPLPNSRAPVLRMEQDVERFIRNPSLQVMEFQPMASSYHRAAAHRVAQHYSLQTSAADSVTPSGGECTVRGYDRFSQRFDPGFGAQAPNPYGMQPIYAPVVTYASEFPSLSPSAPANAAAAGNRTGRGGPGGAGPAMPGGPAPGPAPNASVHGPGQSPGLVGAGSAGLIQPGFPGAGFPPGSFPGSMHTGGLPMQFQQIPTLGPPHPLNVWRAHAAVGMMAMHGRGVMPMPGPVPGHVPVPIPGPVPGSAPGPVPYGLVQPPGSVGSPGGVGMGMTGSAAAAGTGALAGGSGLVGAAGRGVGQGFPPNLQRDGIMGPGAISVAGIGGSAKPLFSMVRESSEPAPVNPRLEAHATLAFTMVGGGDGKMGRMEWWEGRGMLAMCEAFSSWDDPERVAKQTPFSTYAHAPSLSFTHAHAYPCMHPPLALSPHSQMCEAFSNWDDPERVAKQTPFFKALGGRHLNYGIDGDDFPWVWVGVGGRGWVWVGVGGCGCGWVWVGVGVGGCGWVWVGVGVGGCGWVWVWVGVGGCGWVWVGVGGCGCGWDVSGDDLPHWLHEGTVESIWSGLGTLKPRGVPPSSIKFNSSRSPTLLPSQIFRTGFMKALQRAFGEEWFGDLEAAWCAAFDILEDMASSGMAEKGGQKVVPPAALEMLERMQQQ